jgi:hypothetical protein
MGDLHLKGISATTRRPYVLESHFLLLSNDNGRPYPRSPAETRVPGDISMSPAGLVRRTAEYSCATTSLKENCIFLEISQSVSEKQRWRRAAIQGPFSQSVLRFLTCCCTMKRIVSVHIVCLQNIRAVRQGRRDMLESRGIESDCTSGHFIMATSHNPIRGGST